MPHFAFKTKPWGHQLRGFELSKDHEAFAYLMEMRTGKTKIVLDVAARLATLNCIDALFIVAPNGVHRNWITNEVPTHFALHHHAEFWDAQKNGTMSRQRAQRRKARALPAPTGMPIFSMNVEAFATDKGVDCAIGFLKKHRCMFVIDESTDIKSQKAKRTKNILKLSRLASFKRIAEGTPITKSPLDYYTQFRFLDPRILGFDSYYAYRNRYAVLKRMVLPGRPAFDHVVGYQNLEELKEKVAPYSYRVLARDCADLPEHVYQRVYVELTTQQRRLYNSIKEEFVAEYNGGAITAPLAITRLLRLQQITGGFAPLDNTVAEDNGIAIDDKNPRLEAMLDILEKIDAPTIVWARFKPELRMIAHALRIKYGRENVVEYHGEVSNDAREHAKAAFDTSKPFNNRPLFFVGQQAAGGRGLPLDYANAMVYYSNDFSLRTRLQSEARADTVDTAKIKKKGILVVDIEAVNTVDKKIVDTLRTSKELAETVLGDDPREWI